MTNTTGTWYRVHPTHRYAKMVDRGVTAPGAWEMVADRLRNQADHHDGLGQSDRATFCRDRAYDAYQRAGHRANDAWQLSR